MNLRFALLLLTLAFATSTTSAAYVTGFENPPFVSADINGQDSWTTSANTVTARVRTASEIATDLTNAGLDPAAPVHGGSQALMVSGAGASNATIRAISGLETESVVLLDIWARPLIGGSTGNIFLTMEDSGGDRAAAFRFGTAFGNTIDYGTNIGSVWQPSTTIWDANSWYELTMRVDYTTKTYDFSINGAQVNASPIPFYNALSDNFSQIRIFRGANQSGMIVDDFLVTIPEPRSDRVFTDRKRVAFRPVHGLPRDKKAELLRHRGSAQCRTSELFVKEAKNPFGFAAAAPQSGISLAIRNSVVAGHVAPTELDCVAPDEAINMARLTALWSRRISRMVSAAAVFSRGGNRGGRSVVGTNKDSQRMALRVVPDFA